MKRCNRKPGNPTKHLPYVWAAIGLSLAGYLAAAPGHQPVYIYLYAKATDHVNVEMTETRLRHILPEVEIVCDHVQIIHKGRLVFNGEIDVLKQQRHGNKLILGLHRAPEMAELMKVPGVVSVEPVRDHLLRVQYENGKDPAEALVKTAVKKDWGLFHIAPDQTSLEEVFVQLTQQDPAH